MGHEETAVDGLALSSTGIYISIYSRHTTNINTKKPVNKTSSKNTMYHPFELNKHRIEILD
jgi:hypothetical protein